MFSADEIRKLKSMKRLIWSTALAGLIMFAGSFIGIIYLCSTHMITYQNKSILTMYAYAGIAVGAAFFAAGMIFNIAFRIIDKHIH